MVAEQFSVFETSPWRARYNIAPSQPVIAVRMAGGGAKAASGRELVWLRWGLIPGWADDPAIGNRLINARAETAAQKPAFRAAMRQRRCLVVADGFYEWQKTGKRKVPHLIGMRDDRPFGFAALWEVWQRPDQPAIESCTLLTTEANELVRPLHDRMPAIVAPSDYDRWLDPAVASLERLMPLLRPYPSDVMTAFAVSPLVNSPANDEPRCVEPAEPLLGE